MFVFFPPEPALCEYMNGMYKTYKIYMQRDSGREKYSHALTHLYIYQRIRSLHETDVDCLCVRTKKNLFTSLTLTLVLTRAIASKVKKSSTSSQQIKQKNI